MCGSTRAVGSRRLRPEERLRACSTWEGKRGCPRRPMPLGRGRVLMKFWQSIAFTEADQLIEVAKICEEVGFDGVMISDHLLHFEQLQSRYPYIADGKPPSFSAQTVWPECWSIIAALAARRLS